MDSVSIARSQVARRNPGVRIGCAGWSLSSAVQPAFPREGSHLQRYAAVLSAVEINSAFYRPHLPATYQRWRDSVPDAFRFSVKIPKAITHENRLRQADALLEKFIAETAQLGEKLGCLLLQLPPSLPFDAPTVQSFFERLRTLTPVSVACEPRHRSWFEADAADLLSRFEVVYVEADPPVAPLPVDVNDTALRYIRLHGSPVMYHSVYPDAWLRRLAQEMKAARQRGQEVWCVFDNTASGAAIPDALALRTMVKDAG